MAKLFGKKTPSGEGASLAAKLASWVAKPAFLLSLALAVPLAVPQDSHAAGGTRSLKLYFVHTGEKATITFKRNGNFDPQGLQQLNRFLRDWRRNQPTKMDPRLFDLVWEVYRQSGSRDYIHVVSAFRSPATNSMLRSRTKGVAEKSQHMLGKAMDFYLPDVKLATLRSIGMKMQTGGVGFYPKSGSPFVHMDVGNVRSWPRMSRQELVRLFPDGKTMHLPADGQPLPGYQQALADYKRRGGSVQIEMAEATSPKRKGFFATLFGGGADEAEESGGMDAGPVIASPRKAIEAQPRKQQQAPAAPVVEDAQPVMTARLDTPEPSINAPVPMVRPAFREPVAAGMATALLPSSRSSAQEALQAAIPATPQPQQEQQPDGFADLAAYRIPVPELLARPQQETASAEEMLDQSALEKLAYVPVPGSRPEIAGALAAQAKSIENNRDKAAIEQASLSPAVVAALSSGFDASEDNDDAYRTEAAALAASTGADQADYSTDEPDDEDGAEELAAVEPAPLLPETVKALQAAAATPSKGGRPKKADAVAASRDSVRTEPKLTNQIISQWAISQARVELNAKPVKAPRFVSPTLRAQPSTVYTAGFSSQTASVDPGRFSGNAVNFMEVRKFDK